MCSRTRSKILKHLKDTLYGLGALSVFIIPVAGYAIATKCLSKPDTKTRNLIIIGSQLVGSCLALSKLGDIFGL